MDKPPQFNSANLAWIPLSHGRNETRSHLREQLDSVEKPYQKFVKTVEESRQLAEEDRKGAALERECQQQQRLEMMKYRDNNKMVRNQIIYFMM